METHSDILLSGPGKDPRPSFKFGLFGLVTRLGVVSILVSVNGKGNKFDQTLPNLETIEVFRCNILIIGKVWEDHVILH